MIRCDPPGPLADGNPLRDFEAQSRRLTGPALPADNRRVQIRSFILRAFAVPAVMAGALLFSGCQSATHVTSKDDGFRSIFDGATLTGWSGRPELWDVRDGAITGETSKLHPLQNNTFLVWTNGVVGNFQLRFKYRIFAGNSGVQYRSAVLDPEKFIVGGYQADLEAGPRFSGILYEERGRGILGDRGQRTTVTAAVDGKTKVNVVHQFASSEELQHGINPELWNEYLIVAQDNHLTHFINGRMTVDVIDQQPDKAAQQGILALQLHQGPPMLVQFRDIQLKR
jgi:hypothetical protein